MSACSLECATQVSIVSYRILFDTVSSDWTRKASSCSDLSDKCARGILRLGVNGGNARRRPRKGRYRTAANKNPPLGYASGSKISSEIDIVIEDELGRIGGRVCTRRSGAAKGLRTPLQRPRRSPGMASTLDVTGRTADAAARQALGMQVGSGGVSPTRSMLRLVRGRGRDFGSRLPRR